MRSFDWVITLVVPSKYLALVYRDNMPINYLLLLGLWVGSIILVHIWSDPECELGYLQGKKQSRKETP